MSNSQFIGWQQETRLMKAKWHNHKDSEGVHLQWHCHSLLAITSSGIDTGLVMNREVSGDFKRGQTIFLIIKCL